MSSPEKVLIGIWYSIGKIEQLSVGIGHGMVGVAVHGVVGVAVHEGHLGGLRKMEWVNRKNWETISSSQTGQADLLSGKVRDCGRVGGRLV